MNKNQKSKSIEEKALSKKKIRISFNVDEAMYRAMQMRIKNVSWSPSIPFYAINSIRADLAMGPDAPFECGFGTSEDLEALHLSGKPDNIIQFTL